VTLLQELYASVSEEIDSLPPQQKYVPLPSPVQKMSRGKKKKNAQEPTTDSAQNSLINYLWANQNSDAV